jgi:hypothetical protein
MDWQTFTVTILSSSVVATFLTTLINGLMNYQTKIKAIREAGLYLKRAEVLDEIMKRMERLNRRIEELISFFQEDGSKEAERKRDKDAKEAFNLFFEYYAMNRHYLPKRLDNGMKIISGKYKKLIASYCYSVKPGGNKLDVKKWQQLVEEYKDDFVEEKENLAGEFRKIIGVK